jgi:hypothetical protein
MEQFIIELHPKRYETTAYGQEQFPYDGPQKKVYLSQNDVR